MHLTSERTRELLAKAGAVREGHFVGTSGKHLSIYVAKDRATRLTSIASELCAGIAALFAQSDIDAVMAPAVGGIALSQWTAYHLSILRPDRPEVLTLYSEHNDQVLSEIPGGEKVIRRLPEFVLKRGFAHDVKGKRVLAVEDTMTTGESAASTIRAIRNAGGIVVGLGAVANGGRRVRAEEVGVDRLEALMNVDGLRVFTEEDCIRNGMCAEGIPIDTEFGHGAAFLARRQTE